MVGFEGLTALSDNAEAIIKEVSEAVSAALDELHFTVEAFGDAVVFCEAPHAGDLLAPGGESRCKSDQLREPGGFEFLD